jgi:hypothetical protein
MSKAFIMEPSSTSKTGFFLAAVAAILVHIGACKQNDATAPDSEPAAPGQVAQEAEPAAKEVPPRDTDVAETPAKKGEEDKGPLLEPQVQEEPLTGNEGVGEDEEGDSRTPAEGAGETAPDVESAAAPATPAPEPETPVVEPREPAPGEVEGEMAEAEQASAAPAEGTEPGPPQPLVDDPEELVKLHPKYPVWFDKARKSVVIVGEVCQRRVPLELFACLKGSKEHESVVVVPTLAYLVHAGLLAAGAEPGGPVQFHPEYIPARGPEVEVTVLWKDAQGKVQKARAQEWVRDVETGKSMEHPWVFAGSHFSEDEETGERYYHGDTDGDLICVSNFPSAVLDLPIASSDSNASLLFEAFTEKIPPRGTPVTLVLTPKPAPEGETEPPSDEPKPKPNDE